MTFRGSRRRARRPASVGALAAVSLSLLTGCGGGGSGGANTGEPKFGSEEFGLTLEELTVRVEQAEAAVGLCMSKAGFPYLPVDFVTVKKAMDSDQTAPGMSDEQYVAQFGLGVTTQLEKPIIAFGAGPQNQKILEGMPAPNQVAYRRALWGEQAEWTMVRALEEEDFSQTEGCTRAAAEQHFSATELTGSYVNPGDTLIESDRRMIAALKRWSACMRAAGFDYDHPDAITDDLRERLATVTRGQDPKALSATAQRELKALQGEELAIARAETTCFEANVEEVEATVEAEIYGAGQQ